MEDIEAMNRRYRNVFGSSEGRSVLGNILTVCHFGETLDPENPVQVAEYNVGLAIAFRSGALNLILPQLGMTEEK